MSDRFSAFPHAAAICLLGTILLAPCQARKVKTVTGDNVDFASYKTYQWLPPKVLGKAGVSEDDAVLGPAIKNAVNAELMARGLKEVFEGGDLLVSTVALRAASPQLEAVIFPMGSRALDYTTPIASMGRYNHEGTLVVNLIDTRTKKSAWAGLTTETIGSNAGAGVKKIPGAAAAMFKKYPVKK
jgi:hypothetical protein